MPIPTFKGNINVWNKDTEDIIEGDDDERTGHIGSDEIFTVTIIVGGRIQDRTDDSMH